ncbi:MAG: exosortase A [Pacificimonas sp.]
MNVAATVDTTSLSDDRTKIAVDPAWRMSVLCWVAVMVAIAGLFWKDTLHIVEIWWNDSIYAHCLLIPPVIAWLVWQRKPELSELTPRPFLPAAILFAIGGFGWLLGELAGVALVRHTAVIGLMMVSVPLVFGLTVTRGLAFPLFYAIFMIPFGEELIPALQMITADMCIWLLDVFEVPAYIDGVFIMIPNGSFEVAEACSGVRFLIAMVAFSTLVAHLCFRTTIRRIICVVSAIVLAIVANGIRAWGTIYISHLTTPQFAAGVDHVIYGWVFFAIIMAIVLGVGWFFFDRPVDDPAFDPVSLQPTPIPTPQPSRIMTAAGLGIVLAAASPAYSAFIVDRAPDSVTTAVAMPTIDGWTKVESRGSDWRPLYDNASASAWQSYENLNGDVVDLFIAVYDRQTSDVEMITYGNGLLEPDGDWSWGQNIANSAGGRGVQLQRVPFTREVWHYYVIGDQVTGSDYDAKLATLETRLTGGPTRAATIVITNERVSGQPANVEAMAAFRAALGDPVALIDRVATTD